uniref:Uncharacterized protein n=1 Tax=viral metagenome TaxID=1070528 RepID=A0A6C0KD37_9ZZZZ
MSAEFAKTHLREHLVSLLIGPVAEGFWSIYESAKELCERNGQTDQILRTFQNMLTRIPDWNESTLTTEEERIVKQTKCTYMDDLLMGVFISYMKAFANLHYRGKQSELKIDFQRPSLQKFLHELYKTSARKFWQVAYFFKTVGVTAEQQARNRQDIEKMIAECMEQVIRGFLPWEAIAKKYFNEDGGPDSESDDEPPSKGVSFGDVSESDSDDDDEGKHEIHIGEEDGTIEFEDLDKPEPTPAPEPEPTKEIDPLAEIEGRVSSETLVLKL